MVQDSSSRSLWSHDRVEHAHTAVTRLLDSQQDGGWPSSLQFRLDVLVLEALSKGKVTQTDLLPALKEMRLQGKKTAQQFDEHFLEYLRNKATTSKSISTPPTCRFLFPFNLSFESGLRAGKRVQVLGRTYCFRSWRSVIEEIGPETIKTVLTRATGSANPQLTDTCVEVIAAGYDTLSAWNDLEPSFDALRGLLELTLGLGSLSRSYPQKPRRIIACPLWGIALIQENRPDWLRFYVHETDKKERSYKITKEEYQAFKKNATFFSRCRSAGSMEELLVDCLRLYSQAMDARLNHECFIGLWQLAESITQVNRYQGDKKRLCSRLSFFGQLWKSTDTECLKDALELLYEKRNEVVHRGLHKHIDDADLNLLKMCCDAGLVWLLGHRKSLTTTNHLDLFFTWISQSDLNLAAMEKTLSQVKAHRERKKGHSRLY